MILKFLLLILITSSVYALSAEQKKTLEKVLTVTRQYKDSRAEAYPKTLAAICLTESSAGEMVEGDLHLKDDRSLGIMQMRTSTVRHLQQYPEFNFIKKMSDSQIRQRLLKDDDFAIKLAVKYFIVNLERHDYFRSISLYNGGVRNYLYVNKVLKNLKIIKAAVKNGELQT